MTILKAEILLHLNKELYRTETDIDEYVLEALRDLSLKDDFLWVETTVPTLIGRPYYSEPLDFKHLLTIKINDNRPLGKISWAEYQILIRDQTAADRDLPNRFTQHGGFWYAYPTPDAVYTVTLFYSAFVLKSEMIDGVEVKAVNNIGRYFSDKYRSAIYTKTKAVYCRSLGWTDRQVDFETEYQRILLPPLKALVKHEPRFTKYNDL